MKKIFVAMLALAAATACSNDELVSVNQEAIAFDNAFVNNAVRIVDPSLTTDALKAEGNGFGVYGFVTNGDATAPIFTNEKVWWDNSAWTHGTVQYWIAGATYNFAAIAPYGAYADVNPLTTGLSLQFTNDGTTDLIYAQSDAIVGKTTGNTAVAFDFKHVLSKVKFTFKNEYQATNSYIAVKEIKITDADEGATVVLSKTTDGVSAVWTNANDEALTLAFGDAGKIEQTDADGAECAKELFLIPSTERTYNVTYVVELYIDDTKIDTYNHTATVTFAPAAGCCYNVAATITHKNIDPEKEQETIEFTVTTIGGWGTSNGVDAVVPEK